jgi:hypothetical protein
MTKQTIIKRTVEIINQLPEDKAMEISDFADFLIKRYEDQVLVRDIQNTISESHSLDFLKNEEDLYSESDLKEVYND